MLTFSFLANRMQDPRVSEKTKKVALSIDVS